MTFDPPKQDQIETVRVLPAYTGPGKVIGLLDGGLLLPMPGSVLVLVLIVILVLASLLMVLVSKVLVVLLTFESVSILFADVTFVLVLCSTWVVLVLLEVFMLLEMLLLMKMFVWPEGMDLDSTLPLLPALLYADAEAAPLEADAVSL